AAVNFLKRIGMNNIRTHEKELISYTLKQEEESGIKNLISYGTRNIESRAGIYAFNVGEIPRLGINPLADEGISFMIKAIHPHDLSAIADRIFGVELRSGHHCAMPMTEDLGVTSTVRASYYIYNRKEDIDRLFDAIRAGIKRFGL
ncbi:cysteine desulfurase, SufS subfamily, partial [mine drainage metagenome]